MANYSEKLCIVGAGPSGLAVAKNFAQAEIPFDCVEQQDDLGGNWYYGSPASSVYRSTHLISSKRLTEFLDYPMPKGWPPFPHHTQVLEYFKNYARHFNIYDRIEFNTAVLKIEPVGSYWNVHLSSGEVRTYRGVVIANGHNWDPQWPNFPGSFDGLELHSSQYKTADVLVGKRVLVVGAGNSGCDIAVESAQHAAQTFQSLRRGYHYLPKFLFGRPIDQCGEMLLRYRLPLWLRRAISTALIRIALGRPETYGLPQPDHKLFESHPIINSQMLYHVGHGSILVRPDVAKLCDDRVLFADGREEIVDVIIYATGFHISFPFISREHLNWHNGRPELYLNVFHPQHDNLFVAGLIQPDSGQWGLVDLQARLIVKAIQANDSGSAWADRFRQLKQHDAPDLASGIRYLKSSRHLLEVEHFAYRQKLEKLIKTMSA